MQVPHRHGKDGWYGFRAFPSKYLAQLWFLSRADEDWERLTALVDTDSWKTLRYGKGKGDANHAGPWLMYVRGENDDYPMQILRACYRETTRRLDQIHDNEYFYDIRRTLGILFEAPGLKKEYLGILFETPRLKKEYLGILLGDIFLQISCHRDQKSW